LLGYIQKYYILSYGGIIRRCYLWNRFGWMYLIWIIIPR